MENKYLKAFNFLFNYEVLHKNVPNVGKATKGSFELECWNDLKELVDKETPMKPLVTEVVDDNGAIDYDRSCPNCKELMYSTSDLEDWSDGIKYCWNCGQKLDWRSE